MPRESSGHGQANKARGSPKEQILQYAAQIKGLSQLFLYGLDLRAITKPDIDEWEAELRGIIEGLERLRKNSLLDTLLTSCDGFEASLRKAIRHLYIASDILQKGNPTIEERRELYRAFEECSNTLSCSIDFFHSSIKTLLDN